MKKEIRQVWKQQFCRTTKKNLKNLRKGYIAEYLFGDLKNDKLKNFIEIIDEILNEKYTKKE